VIYNKPSVYQKRNVHNLAKDLEKEMIGHKNSLLLIKSKKPLDVLPEMTKIFYNTYMRSFKSL